MSAYTTYHDPRGFSYDSTSPLPRFLRRMSPSREQEDFEGFMILRESLAGYRMIESGRFLTAGGLHRLLEARGRIGAHCGFRSPPALGHLLLRVYDHDLGGVVSCGDLLAIKELSRNGERARSGQYAFGTNILTTPGVIDPISEIMDSLVRDGIVLPYDRRRRNSGRIGTTILSMIDRVFFPEWLHRTRTPHVGTTHSIYVRLTHNAEVMEMMPGLTQRSVAHALAAAAGTNARITRLTLGASTDRQIHPVYRISPPAA